MKYDIRMCKYTDVNNGEWVQLIGMMNRSREDVGKCLDRAESALRTDEGKDLLLRISLTVSR